MLRSVLDAASRGDTVSFRVGRPGGEPLYLTLGDAARPALGVGPGRLAAHFRLVAKPQSAPRDGSAAAVCLAVAWGTDTFYLAHDKGDSRVVKFMKKKGKPSTHETVCRHVPARLPAPLPACPACLCLRPAALPPQMLIDDLGMLYPFMRDEFVLGFGFTWLDKPGGDDAAQLTLVRSDADGAVQTVLTGCPVGNVPEASGRAAIATATATATATTWQGGNRAAGVSLCVCVRACACVYVSVPVSCVSCVLCLSVYLSVPVCARVCLMTHAVCARVCV